MAPKFNPNLQRSKDRLTEYKKSEKQTVETTNRSLAQASRMTKTKHKKQKSKLLDPLVGKLTKQQEFFAKRMDDMRKEAKKKNKKDFALVKKMNDAILAEKEERYKQDTYQRLYETGTKKLQGMQDDDERQPRIIDIAEDYNDVSAYPLKSPSKTQKKNR